MKNAFKLSSLLFIGAILFQVSCSEDPVTPPEDPAPDPTGKWALSLAVLVSPDPLVITNFTDGTTAPFTLEVPAGEATAATITQIVVAGLAGQACVDPANYATFYVEFTSDGKLILNCPAENVTSEAGTWLVQKDTNGDYTIFSISVLVEGVSAPLTILLNDFAIAADGATFSGRTPAYPTKKDFLADFTLDNAQFMEADLTFTKIP